MGYYKKQSFGGSNVFSTVGLLRTRTLWIETKVSLHKKYFCLNIDESPNIDAFYRSAQYQTVDMFGNRLFGIEGLAHARRHTRA